MNSLDPRHPGNSDSEQYHGRPPDKCFLITKLLLTASLLSAWLYLPNDGLSGGWRSKVFCVYLCVHPCACSSPSVCMCCCYVYVFMCTVHMCGGRGQCWVSLSLILYLVYHDRLSRKLTNSARTSYPATFPTLGPQRHTVT